MTCLFASVAVPRPVRRLFTYSVPPALAPRCRRGVRVIVPFGRRRLTGYLLDLQEGKEPADAPYPLKPIEQVLDAEPVLDESILALTRFAADYYIASLGEMIVCPRPGMKGRVRRIVSVTGSGRSVLEAGGGVLVDASLPRIAADPLAREILGVVAEFTSARGAAIRLEDLSRRVGPRFKTRTLERLRAGGLLEVTEVAVSPGPRPYLEEHVDLSTRDDPPAAVKGSRRRRILAVLKETGGRMPLPALLKASGAPRDALRALEKLGLVRIESQEVPRRPASLGLPLEPLTELSLTVDQKKAIEA